jgi:hypothetical protein
MPRLITVSLFGLFRACVISAATFQPNYDESKVPAYTLPDPLLMQDGTRVPDAGMWRTKRRPELLEQFAREVYGRTPQRASQKLHWAVTSVDRAALDGKAVRNLRYVRHERSPA